MNLSGKLVLFLFVCILLTGNPVWGGFKFEYSEQIKGEIGFWGQAWYQYVEDGQDSDGNGISDKGLNDFMIRRAYFYIKGQATPYLSIFTHIAADRAGQDELDNPSVGLGSGVAFRDLWITLKADETFKIQAGRMYVPFTRNYGTTSTKALLTTDLDWTQGGIRSNIFYPSKVGRDDGVTLWGNIKDGLFQYRFMVAEGVESDSINPDDNLRIAGRISISPFDPETGWFNQGTYLGKKRVLSVGAGADYQQDLMFGSREDDYSAWTLDAFYDQPIGTSGAFTFEGAYINIENGPNNITFTQLSSGDDGSIISLKAGYLFTDKLGPGQIQPFAHWQYIDVDESGKDNTNVYGFGLNYFLKGHANKISLDFAFVDQDEEVLTQDVQDHFIFTFQLAAGF
ncbi:MAG: hypothetical protein JRH18_24210 [Deltaproteobacteria bacterium]|nr:hypothetical protein [Deltaproteobacteria bacterium]MBW2154753.1 hypothetical protein [Deltaproteobacteria bacterium]